MGDLNGKTYEFISKTRVQPVKEMLDGIIRKVQTELRKEGITFQPALVGSAGRNLVTGVVSGNSGFDFDYNLILKKCSFNEPEDIKDIFIRTINKVIKGTAYSNAENKTQVITIKVVDKKNSKILHSCDFAIVNEYDDGNDFYQEILIKNKNNNTYVWNKRPFAKNYSSKISNIISNGLWPELKEEYLKLKNKNNDPEKKSFSLYFEALNNVYNKYDWN